MRIAHHVAHLVLVLGAATAAVPADGPVRFPAAPPPKADPPAVKPDPGVILRVPADHVYVIDSDVPLADVIASPAGLAEVTAELGPLKMRAKFVGGTGKLETKQFNGKAVYTITPIGTGQAELFVIPEGAKKGTILRRQIFVDSGESPRPPPVPPIDPKVDPVPPKPIDPTPPPKPKTEPPIPGPGFRVLVVFETAQKMSPGQFATVYGRDVRTYLDTKCVRGPDGKTPEYRIYDQDVDLTAESAVWRNAMVRAKSGIAAWKPLPPGPDGKPVGPQKPLPWIIVSDGVSSGFEGPVPLTLPESLDILKMYGG